jgi:hypothetical protein
MRKFLLTSAAISLLMLSPAAIGQTSVSPRDTPQTEATEQAGDTTARTTTPSMDPAPSSAPGHTLDHNMSPSTSAQGAPHTAAPGATDSQATTPGATQTYGQATAPGATGQTYGQATTPDAAGQAYGQSTTPGASGQSYGQSTAPGQSYGQSADTRSNQYASASSMDLESAHELARDAGMRGLPMSAAEVCQPRTISAPARSLSRDQRNRIEAAVDRASVCELQNVVITAPNNAAALRQTLVQQGVDDDRISVERGEAGEAEVRMTFSGIATSGGQYAEMFNPARMASGYGSQNAPMSGQQNMPSQAPSPAPSAGSSYAPRPTAPSQSLETQNDDSTMSPPPGDQGEPMTSDPSPSDDPMSDEPTTGEPGETL